MTDYETTRRQTLGTMAALGLPMTPNLLAQDDDAATEKPKQPPLTNPRSIFQGIPADAAPKPNKGWDKYSFPRAVAWVNLTWTGRTLRMSRRVHDVSIQRNTLSKSAEDRWRVSVTVKNDSFNFRGLPIRVKLGQFLFTGDEQFAMRSERIRENKIVVASGEISSARLAATGTETFDVRIGLKDYALSGIA